MQLDEWDIDFGAGRGTADFTWDDDKFIVRVYFNLDFDVHCEWTYFGGRDIEQCTPVALIHSYRAVKMRDTNAGWEEHEEDELSREDENELQYLIDDEYPKYLNDQVLDMNYDI